MRNLIDKYIEERVELEAAIIELRGNIAFLRDVRDGEIAKARLRAVEKIMPVEKRVAKKVERVHNLKSMEKKWTEYKDKEALGNWFKPTGQTITGRTITNRMNSNIGGKEEMNMNIDSIERELKYREAKYDALVRQKRLAHEIGAEAKGRAITKMTAIQNKMTEESHAIVKLQEQKAKQEAFEKHKECMKYTRRMKERMETNRKAWEEAVQMAGRGYRDSYEEAFQKTERAQAVHTFGEFFNTQSTQTGRIVVDRRSLEKRIDDQKKESKYYQKKNTKSNIQLSALLDFKWVSGKAKRAKDRLGIDASMLTPDIHRARQWYSENHMIPNIYDLILEHVKCHEEEEYAGFAKRLNLSRDELELLGKSI